MPKSTKGEPAQPKGEMPWWAKSGKFQYGAPNDPWRIWGEAMQKKWLQEQQAKYLQYLENTKRAQAIAAPVVQRAGGLRMPAGGGMPGLTPRPLGPVI